MTTPARSVLESTSRDNGRSSVWLLARMFGFILLGILYPLPLCTANTFHSGEFIERRCQRRYSHLTYGMHRSLKACHHVTHCRESAYILRKSKWKKKNYTGQRTSIDYVCLLPEGNFSRASPCSHFIFSSKWQLSSFGSGDCQCATITENMHELLPPIVLSKK